MPVGKFITWDTEGHEIDGIHRTVLIANSRGDTIFNRKGLTYEDLLPFIARYRDSVNVWYSFGYDINMIFRDLALPTKQSLFTKGVKTLINLNGDEYIVKYIPRKILTIKKGSQTYTHYDAFGFFQSSFIKALDQWKIDYNTELMAAGKKLRGDFRTQSQEFIEAYNMEECIALEKTMLKLDEYIQKAGIPELRSYHGAGAIASRFLKMWHVDEHKTNLPTLPEHKDLFECRRYSYFGGRAELFYRGHVGALVYHYDINSAYPTACLYIPSLVNKTWSHLKGSKISDISPNDYGVLKCKWKLDNIRVGPLPFRQRDNYVTFPANGEGWFHNIEVQTALARGYNIKVEEAYILDKPYTYFLRDPVNEMAKKRLELKKKGDMGNIPIKLGLNSLYGKLAQRPIRKETNEGELYWKYGEYVDLFWSGFITAYARAQLLKHMDFKNVIMVATDGLFSKVELPSIEVGENLGQWEYSQHEDGIFLLSGVYALKGELNINSKGERKQKEEGWHLKTRGYTNMQMSDFDKIFSQQLEEEVTTWVERRFVGNKLAMTSPKYKMCEFQEVERKINWNNNKKRVFFSNSRLSDSTPVGSEGFSKIYDPKGMDELEKLEEDAEITNETISLDEV